MNVGILAARTQVAQEKMLAAAEALADRFGLTDRHQALIDARSKDRDVAMLLQREAVAELLDALVKATDPGVPVPDDTERMDVLTVAEAKERIDAAGAETLDAIEAAETAGKGRKGVLAAIAARRDVLTVAEANGSEDEPESAPDGNSEPNGAEDAPES